MHAIIFNDSVVYGNIWQRTAGAYAIATQMRQYGYTCQVIDFFSFLTLQDNKLVYHLLDKFIDSETIFVGFSSTFMGSTFGDFYNKPFIHDVKLYNTTQRSGNIYGTPDIQLLELKAFIKSKNPKIDIVAGGSRVGSGHDPIADIRIQGYGEMQLMDYLKWKTGKNPLFSPIINENGSRTINHNTKADGHPFVQSTLKWEKQDCIQPNETLPIEVSRGCIFSCKFCSFPLNGRSKNDYLKDVDVFRDELIRNHELFGTTRYVFADDTYNDSTEKLLWMNEVRKQLKFKFEFATYARLDLIASKPEQIDLLLENGMSSVFFGIESLNYKSAQSIGKGMKTEKLVETLHKLRETWGNEILTIAGFILGLPHDTYSTMETWLDRMVDHRFPLHSHVVTPLSILDTTKVKRPWYSEFDKDPAKYGYKLIGTEWENSLYGTTTSGCNEMARNFSKYAMSSGRRTIQVHTAIALKDYGYDHRRQILSSVDTTSFKSPLQSQVYQRFNNYVNDLLAL